jgi:hypothetical protein
MQMKTFWNTKIKKRDPECTNVIAVKGHRLPDGYDAAIWQENGEQVKETMAISRLEAIYQNGERFEKYGYL